MLKKTAPNNITEDGLSRFNVKLAMFIFAMASAMFFLTGCELVQQGIDTGGVLLKTFIVGLVQTEVSDAVSDKMGTDWGEVAGTIAGSVTASAMVYLGVKKVNGARRSN